MLSFVFLFFSELSFLAFDEETARAAGIKAGFFNYLLGIIVAITVVVSIRVAGLILVASLIIIPAATSLRLSSNFRHALFLSAFFGVFSLVAGLFLSYYFDIAAGATIVVLNFIIFLLSYALSKK